MSTDSAPYRIKVIDPDAPSDVHLILITALGGDSAVPAVYVTTNGSTGAAAGSVIVNAGVVDEWQDYRHPSSYAPPIIFASTAKPAWDAGAKTITGDGVDDEGITVDAAAFNVLGNKAIVLIGAAPGGVTSWACAITEGTGSRFLAIEAAVSPGSYRFGGSTYPGADSGVQVSTTRRVVIASKTGAASAGIVVPNHARVTEGGNNNTDTSRKFCLFRASLGAGPGGSSCGMVLRAILVLNIDPDTTQQNIIRDYAIANHAAVAAS